MKASLNLLPKSISKCITVVITSFVFIKLGPPTKLGAKSAKALRNGMGGDESVPDGKLSSKMEDAIYEVETILSHEGSPWYGK